MRMSHPSDMILMQVCNFFYECPTHVLFNFKHSIDGVMARLSFRDEWAYFETVEGGADVVETVVHLIVVVV